MVGWLGGGRPIIPLWLSGNSVAQEGEYRKRGPFSSGLGGVRRLTQGGELPPTHPRLCRQFTAALDEGPGVLGGYHSERCSAYEFGSFPSNVVHLTRLARNSSFRTLTPPTRQIKSRDTSQGEEGYHERDVISSVRTHYLFTFIGLLRETGS
ncbi:hypothetical protein VTI74DRAFT_11580 [Chaetomium olivicolor]